MWEINLPEASSRKGRPNFILIALNDLQTLKIKVCWIGAKDRNKWKVIIKDSNNKLSYS